MSGQRVHHTMRGIAGFARPMMLGLLAAIALCGCHASPEIPEKNILAGSYHAPPAATAEPSPSRQPAAEPEATAEPVEPQPEQQQHVERPPVTESDRLDPSATAVTSLAPLKRVDPGAAYIVRAVQHRLESTDPPVMAADLETPIVIDLTSIRNQSRATHGEFKRFLARFAELLSAAGESHNLVFTGDPEATAHYRLFGTAYLLSADGFDWWELFLNLRPRGETATMWRCGHPVRVMRHHRPEHQQVFLAPRPRIRN